MKESKRIKRVNSLLKEVISDVIRHEVDNPNISPLITITKVETSLDLRNATVYISIFGDEKSQEATLDGLKKSAKFIAIISSKKIVLKYFPAIFFKIDNSAEKHQKIETILNEIKSNDN